MFNGILLIDKPKGWTSFDVVAKVRGLLRTASNQLSVTDSTSQTADNGLQVTSSKKIKVGHTGTLDPLATGLLLIVVGNYCKRAQEFSKLDKTYEVTMCLGQTSITGDEEGVKTLVSDTKPLEMHIKNAVAKFRGTIEQVPPAYSAIKVNGQRAYKLARAGEEVKLAARSVTIHTIELNEYTYPYVRFTTHVSSGTYIRTLVEDIGKELGTGAYMSALRRITVGDYKITNSLPIVDITAESIAENLITTE